MTLSLVLRLLPCSSCWGLSVRRPGVIWLQPIPILSSGARIVASLKSRHKTFDESVVGTRLSLLKMASGQQEELESTKK